jgi:hypothetical protein
VVVSMSEEANAILNHSGAEDVLHVSASQLLFATLET